MRKGLTIAVLHVAIVLAVAGKYTWDREHLPRAWARTANFDPNLPVRGRYVQLSVVVETSAPPEPKKVFHDGRAALFIADGRLAGRLLGAGGRRLWGRNETWFLADPVAFFIPEHAKDPSLLNAGEELWVELSVPPKGAPRPLRLAVKKDGVLTPLALD